MRRQRRKTPDSRTIATRNALIETAERLFGENGFNAVSTRSIGAAIGSANNTVVTYHFGSKDALIEAIFNHRSGQIEQRRKRLFEEAVSEGKADDIETILMAMWLPLFEQVDESGRHSYAAFLKTMMGEGVDQPRKVIGQVDAASRLLVDRIKDRLPFGPGQVWDMRWETATSLVLNALRYIDRLELSISRQAQELFRDAVSMARAALFAPRSDAELDAA